MAQSNFCEMLSIKTLLSNDQYLIPMYQRNYAWEEPHLSQLIQDVYDNHKSDRNYYIGTLVVHRRDDGKLETVDGQQRLTTLNILLCAVKNELDSHEIDLGWYSGVNISYEYRQRSSMTLSALYEHSNDENLHDTAISNMYNNVRRCIESIVPKESFCQFMEYLLEKVIVTRVVLPADTDLNHYFEIMNSRGEQLEKHEILKALIMRSSSKDSHKSWIVGQIWEACADMDRFVPLNFTKEIRSIIFSSEWNTFDWNTLKDMVDQTRQCHKAIEDEQFSLNDVYKMSASKVATEDTKEGDRFESVLKFPGFLLQVLRVMMQDDIPLDDKRLLLTFDKYIKDPDFADRFILKMLKLRFLFDKYVIKRDYKDDVLNGKMSLMTLTKNNVSFSYNPTFSSEENRRVIMIESMFHVSLPSQNYKHWLCAVINYVDKHNQGEGLGCYLEKLARTYMFGRFLAEGPSEDGFYYKIIFHPDDMCQNIPDTIKFPKFTDHVDFFIFNYIDYCIWKFYGNRFANFEFTSRSSVEHFYPQHPLSGPDMDEEHLHDIGNLCLISASKNSELNNYSPSAKTEHYGKSGYDSPKQALMMDVINYNKSRYSDATHIWWNSEVEKHHKDIEELIKKSYNQLGSD